MPLLSTRKIQYQSPGAFQGTAPPFDPLDLNPDLLLDPSDTTTMWQEHNATTTPADTDGESVGTFQDKSGNGFHLTALASNTTRPVYKTSAGLHWLQFTAASSQVLRRAAGLGMYDAGSCTLVIAVDSNTPATSSRLFNETVGGAGSYIYTLAMTNNTTSSTTCAYLRDDAGTNPLGGGNLNLTNSFDNSPHVIIFTDDGATIRAYKDNVIGTNTNYTRPGAVTDTMVSLGALYRTSTSAAWNGDLYGLAVFNRVIDSTERAQLTTYFGTKMGLSL
jgi:hypothetical protein